MDDTRSRALPAWLRWLAATVPVTPLLRWAVLVHSVPPEEPWRSGCPHCATGFSPAQALDGLGALLPAGRCAGCGDRIGARAYAVELAALAAAGLVAVAAVAGGRSPWEAVAFAGWAAVAVALSFVDLAVHRLPDRLTLPAGAWVLAWLGVDALTGEAGSGWLRALIAAGSCGLAFALITLVFGARGFGLGDAKMALGAGAVLGWLGWTALVAGLLLSFLASGLTATVLLVARRVGRKDTLPFGPFLAAGTLVTLAWVGLS
jgi:leader peptidase (prepilin peptidase) / N-methyltransferase